MKKNSIRALMLFLFLITLSAGLSIPASAATAKKPARPVITYAKLQSNGSIIVKWKKAANAKKYILYVSENNGKYKKLATQTKRSFTHKGLKAGAVYSYKVRAINGKKKSADSKVKKVKAPTVWGYYTILKNYMIKKKQKNADGNPIISKTVNDGGGTTRTIGIAYEKSKNTYMYVWYCAGDNIEQYVTMNVNQSILKSGKAPLEYAYLNSYSETGFLADASLSMTSCNGKSDVKFTFSEVEGSFTDDNLQTLSNTALQSAVTAWKELVSDQVQVPLSNLGFPKIK